MNVRRLYLNLENVKTSDFSLHLQKVLHISI